MPKEKNYTQKKNHTSKLLESLFWKSYWIVLFLIQKQYQHRDIRKKKNYVLTVLLTKMLVVFHCIPFGYVNNTSTFLTSFCVTTDHYYFLLSSLRLHEEHFHCLISYSLMYLWPSKCVELFLFTLHISYGFPLF